MPFWFGIVRFSICMWVVLNSSASIVAAQDPSGMPRLSIPEKTPDVLTPGIRPDAILMRSGMGENVLVPKAKYEEFERFLSTKNALPAGGTSTPLERLELDVKVSPNLANLKVNASAVLSEGNTDWLSLPIALSSIQVVPSVNPAPGSASFPPLRVSSDNSGYVWRVAPGNQGQRQLQFEAITKVRTLPQGNSIRLELPSVQSIVRLELPLGQWDLNVVGNGSEIAEPFQDSEKSSVAIVRATGGTTTLTWTKKAVAEQVQAIEVESFTSYVTLAEPGEFRAAARVTIRGPKMLGGRRFLISLPPRSQWREPMANSSSFPGYRLSRSEGSEESSDVVLLLEFEEAFSRTEIELPIEWQTKSSSESEATDFAMLRVEGVQRHIGNLDIAIPRNVSLRWEPQSNFQFTRQTQSSDGSDSLNYSFRFHQQMEPLKVHLSVGDRASELKATYNVAVDPSVLRLNGSIDILGDVRSLPFLQLDVRGWSVERVQLQPSGRDLDIVAIRSRSTTDSSSNDSQTLEQQTTTSIPLSLGELLDVLQSKNGSLGGGRPTTDAIPQSTELPSLNARDELVRQPTRSISFVLSRPIASAVKQEVTKHPIEFSLPMLSWLDPETQLRQSMSIGSELTIQSSTSDLAPFESVAEKFQKVIEPSTTNRRSSLKYRVEKSTSWVQWSGTFESLGTAIEAASHSQVLLTPEELNVTQTWRLLSSPSEVRTLKLALPKEWLLTNSINITVDGIPVASKETSDESNNGLLPFVSLTFQQRYAWFQIELPTSERNQISSRERTLAIRYKSKRPLPLDTLTIPFDCSLPWIAASGADDSLVVNKYDGEVVHDDSIACMIQSPLGGAEKTERLGESNTTTIPFDRTYWDPRLIGDLCLVSKPDLSEVKLESVWLQTFVNAIEQRDRYVAKIKTHSRSLTLSIPTVSMASAVFMVNGQKVVPVEKELHRIEIPLVSLDQITRTPEEKTYVLELFIWTSNKSQWLKRLHAEPLSILHSNPHAPFAWQVVVPTTVHVIGSSSTLTPGYRWKWQDLLYERTSEWNQETLGHYMGATVQPFVEQPTNQYVFFSLDHSAPMNVSTAPRYLLWAPVALFVLLASFSVMEFQWIRRPWIVVVLLLLGLAFSQWAWDLSIALSQCLVVALAIAAMYSLLKWGVDRRARRRSVFASRPSSPLIVSSGRSNAPSGSVVLAKSAPALQAPAMKVDSQEQPASTAHSPGVDGGS